MNTTKRGNYYKRKTKEFYEKQGYTCQLTEFACGMLIKGRQIWRKVDIFGADMICMDGKEIIFANSKSTDEFVKDGVAKAKSSAKTEFAKYPFPPSIRKQVVIWQPREEPEVFDV